MYKEYKEMTEAQAKIRAIDREKWAQRGKTMYNLALKPAGWLLGKAWNATKEVGKAIGKGVNAQIDRSVRSYLYQQLDPAAVYTPQPKPVYEAFPERAATDSTSEEESLFPIERETLRAKTKRTISYAGQFGKIAGLNILRGTRYHIEEARRKMRHTRAMATNYGQLEKIADRFTNRGMPMTPREAYEAVRHVAAPRYQNWQ